MIKKSTEIPDDLKAEFERTQKIVLGFVQWLQFCIMDTARDSNFTKNHLLSFLHQDILETLFGVLSHVLEGIHTPPIRESRYLLELSIKVSFIQRERYFSTIEEKLAEFDKEIKAPSISPMKRIDLSYLKDDTKPVFLEEVGRLYGAASSFVHVTPKSIEYRQHRVGDGRIMGKESSEDLTKLNDLLQSIYAASLVFLSHSVPQYVIGDWLVDRTGELTKWHYIGSRYIAEIDSTLDYKAERKEILERVVRQRALGIQF
ncbi:MAG: hypothetical protein GYB58_21845 [Gammaproteobacteria bacterium]|nr:hypothetical protein [Gammaproteobacteria bacterium]